MNELENYARIEFVFGEVKNPNTVLQNLRCSEYASYSISKFDSSLKQALLKVYQKYEICDNLNQYVASTINGRLPLIYALRPEVQLDAVKIMVLLSRSFLWDGKKERPEAAKDIVKALSLRNEEWASITKGIINTEGKTSVNIADVPNLLFVELVLTIYPILFEQDKLIKKQGEPVWNVFVSCLKEINNNYIDPPKPNVHLKILEKSKVVSFREKSLTELINISNKHDKYNLSFGAALIAQYAGIDLPYLSSEYTFPRSGMQEIAQGVNWSIMDEPLLCDQSKYPNVPIDFVVSNGAAIFAYIKILADRCFKVSQELLLIKAQGIKKEGENADYKRSLNNEKKLLKQVETLKRSVTSLENTKTELELRCASAQKRANAIEIKYEELIRVSEKTQKDIASLELDTLDDDKSEELFSEKNIFQFDSPPIDYSKMIEAIASNKKVIIAGGNPKLINKLKSRNPSVVFVGSERIGTCDSVVKNADIVLYRTDSSSHILYNKCRELANLNRIPFRHLDKGTAVERAEEDIYKHLYDGLVLEGEITNE